MARPATRGGAATRPRAAPGPPLQRRRRRGAAGDLPPRRARATPSRRAFHRPATSPTCHRPAARGARRPAPRGARAFQSAAVTCPPALTADPRRPAPRRAVHSLPLTSPRIPGPRLPPPHLPQPTAASQLETAAARPVARVPARHRATPPTHWPRRPRPRLRTVRPRVLLEYAGAASPHGGDHRSRAGLRHRARAAGPCRTRRPDRRTPDQAAGEGRGGRECGRGATGSLGAVAAATAAGRVDGVALTSRRRAAQQRSSALQEGAHTV